MKCIRGLFIVFASLFVISTAAYADRTGCDTLYVTGLTDSQIIDLKKKCIDAMKSVSESVTVSQVSEYAELGKNYGIALSEVAKSVGTTVNELAQTPVGKFMLVMVAYKVMGKDLIGIFGGFIWFTIMLPIWFYLFHRLVLKNRTYREYIESYEKDKQPKVVRREYDALKYDGDTGVMAFFMAIALVFICAAGFFMIF